MYPSPRPLGPQPNYTVRRLVALTVVVVVLYVLFLLVRALFGGGGGEGELSAGTTPTTAGATSTTALSEPLPPCEYRDEQSIYGRPEDWNRTIVDTVYAIPEDYEPTDLVPASAANYSAEFRIRELIASDLNSMRNAILAEGLPEVAILAAYRSVDDQQVLFDRRVQEMGFEAAAEGTARGGHSEHHLGTTIDVRLIGETDVDESFGQTPTGMWLEENSWRYGFVVSYPEGKEDVTCYKYEPWHLRYVGPQQAERVVQSGLTLREYLWHWEVTGREPGTPSAAVTSTTVAGVDDQEPAEGG